MLPISTLMFAAAAGLLGWAIADVLTRPRVVREGDSRFETERRIQLRAANQTYRQFEPLIDEWIALSKFKPDRLEQIEESLSAGGVRDPWAPEEFVTAKRIEGVLIGVASFFVARMILGSSWFGAAMFGGLAGWGFQWLTLRALKSKAVIRQVAMKRRFSGAIDLMALMMEVGAGFQECLDVAVRESKGTALGEELALVQKEISMGALRSTALKGLAERTRDADMVEVIMSINEGEELGTPLTSILRNQADQMRQKRSQWAEKAAEESQVAIVFPAMLIMIACLLIVVAPFVLTVITGGGP